MTQMSDHLRAVGGVLQDVGKTFESWKDEHDQAMLCQDFEEKVAATLPMFDQLDSSIEGVQRAIEIEGAGLTGAQGQWIELLRLLVVYIYNYTTIKIKCFEDAGHRVTNAGSLLARLRNIEESLGLIIEKLDRAAIASDDVSGTADGGAEKHSDILRGIPIPWRAYLRSDRYHAAAPIVFYSGMAVAGLFAYFSIAPAWLGFLAGFLPMSALLATAYADHA